MCVLDNLSKVENQVAIDAVKAHRKRVVEQSRGILGRAVARLEADMDAVHDCDRCGQPTLGAMLPNGARREGVCEPCHAEETLPLVTLGPGGDFTKSLMPDRVQRIFSGRKGGVA